MKMTDENEMTDENVTDEKGKCPKELMERTKTVGGTPVDEGDGYWSLIGKSPAGVEAMMMLSMIDGGCGSGEVAYVQLPDGHPDIGKVGKDYDDLEPDVNGGLTYSNGPVFGWDYCHDYNEGTPSDDIKNAIKYFKERDGRKG
jgi:hypothetical protein